MDTEPQERHLINFKFEGQGQQVVFINTIHVTSGVDCDVYSFVGDITKDLGIIKIQPGAKTPMQKVLAGDKTIEGYISGRGKLTVTKQDGTKIVYEANRKPFEIEVEIGQLMQWRSATDSNLVVYEICFPPYEDGRFENMP